MLASYFFESGPNPLLEFIVSALVLAGGVAVVVVYVLYRRAELKDAAAARRAPRGEEGPARIGGARPWRKLGAAICLLLSVMFVAGLYGLNRETPTKVFFAYWLIMVVLVVWLLGLALRDMMYTRRVLRGFRAGTMTLRGEPVAPEDRQGEQP